MYKSLLAIFTSILVGCSSPQFKINEVDDRFSENKNLMLLSENNRISSKSIAGGIHIDNTGVFLNPFLERDKSTNEIVIIGISVLNITDYNSSYGGVNQLGIIEKVVFRYPNGSLLTLHAKQQDIRTSDTVSYNNISKSASYEKYESAILVLKPEEFKTLATTDTVSCKIHGSKNNVVYEESDIAKSFLENLNTFYKNHLK